MMFINGNPTREGIILLLKKNGPLSIDDMSTQLGITPMGIRQHLLTLERRGLVDYFAKRHGVGRPAFLYRLTDKADELFPKTYHEFVVDSFREMEKSEGRNKIDDIFRWRKERVLREKKEALSDKKSLHDRVYALKDVLETDGYLIDVAEDENNYILKNFNCPIWRVASEFREVCKYELQMFRDLLRKDVMRPECLSEGNLTCTYLIPKAPLKV